MKRKMDLNKSSKQPDHESGSSDSGLSYERQIWTIINNTIIVLFSSLNNKEAITENNDEGLDQLLDSLLCRFKNLNILVPPLTNNRTPKDVESRYTAFTTWLFGAMFYLTNFSVSPPLLKKIIDIQVCMVRILSRLNFDMHNIITTEYLNILDELVYSIQYKPKTDVFKLCKFEADQNAIDYLTLTPFSVVVKNEDIPLFQISILKIIIESDVSVWPTKRLKEQLLEILVCSEPKVKLSVLEVFAEMFDYNLLDDSDVQSVLLYATEIVKSLSNWNELGLISLKECQESLTNFNRIISLVHEPMYVNLYFEILSALVNCSLESDKLKNEISEKIVEHITEVSMFFKEKEIEKFILFFKKCQAFVKVLVFFIVHEIENNTSGIASTDICQMSKLWHALKCDFHENLRSENYEETLKFLHLTNLLHSQLTQNKMELKLIHSDVEDISTQLLKSLATNNYLQNKLIFENFTQLISLKEVNAVDIQKILLLPWLDANALSSKINKTHLANAKSLDTMTKVKCLNAIARYGTGRERLNILNLCICGCDIELGVASVVNCPVLINDKDIKFDDIMEKILVPAYNTQKPLLHESVANIIGPLACLVSENGTIARDSNDYEKWTIQCKMCNEPQICETNDSKFISSKYDTYFNSFFDLINSDSRNVRLNISKNITRFSNHIKSFNTNSLAQKWITYIKDEDEEIRRNFGEKVGIILNNRIQSSNLHKSFQDDISSDLIKFINIIMDNLASVLNQAFDTSNQSLHQTLLLTAKTAACIQLPLTEKKALSIFILTILHVKSTPLAVSLATDAYKEVANYHNVSLKTMYIRYKRHFLKIIMTLAVHNRLNYEYNMSTTVHRVAKCMGFQGSRQLLRKDGHYAVCFLLPLIIKSPKAITLFHDIAELSNVDGRNMFKTYFQHICCRVFLFESENDGIEIFKLVSDIIKQPISVLIADSFSLIVSELMLHFHNQQKKVLQYLQFLSKFDNQQNLNFKSQNEFAQYLNSFLHGVLVTFDANLGVNTEEVMQKYALASLTEVIRFMGPNYITQYKYKILATLRTALNFTRPGFRKLACEAWDAFLKNTSIKELGPLLATICMSVVPLLETYPKETNAMLDYLLIKNRGAVEEYFSDLFFINDLKMSPNISTRVISHIKQTKPETVEENLQVWIKRITHDTDEIRLKALSHLKQFLSKTRDEINDLILSDINVHPIIVELLDTLMAGCQDKNEAVCIASGDCIGELGAIEPSLLPRRIISREDSTFIADINQDFAFALFCELVRDYQIQKNTQSMDCFSLAIQEILRSYEISPGGRNCKFWNDLSSKIQHMIFPLLTSHYTITAATNDAETPNPIYGSESGSTFEMWAFNWTVSMLKCIKDSTISNVLNACRPAFKRSNKIMIFCIPYIVAYIVTNGTLAEIRKLSTEMLAVVATNEKTHLDPELLRNRPLRTQKDNITTSTRVSDEARRVRCLQVVFATLDHLQRWLRERRKVRDNQYERIQKFCDAFPKLLLAKGCYQSDEYHRALIYLEQHMKSSKKGLSESTEGGLLAKIYTQLEEPDGVSGILVSQEQFPTLQQLVLAHQVNGQFQDAATCYERLLQQTTPKPQHLQGMIQCYYKLDQPFTAMNITKGILNDRPELETLICDMEPFWQLAHFEKLGNNSKENIKVDMLEDLKNGVQPDILSIKKKLVSLLTNSSISGAYEQSYAYIMKLHIVNEFEKACKMMLEDRENLYKIFDEWKKRDKLINASRGAEFVLGMRRAILDLAVQLNKNIETDKSALKKSTPTDKNAITEEIGKLWLKSAKIARKAGMYQQAYMYILSGNDYCPPQDLLIEQSQLYWQKGSHEDALITLRRCLSTFFKPHEEYKKQPPGAFSIERKQCAKAKLLWAKYNDETLNVDANGNMWNYKEAHEVWKNWEKSCLSIARYYESVIDKMTDDERMLPSGRDMQTHIINYYGKSLMCGCKYIHQSLPRMLTVWLNYASRARMHSSSDSAIAKTLSQMTKIIEVYIERVPLFIWLTAFSQLVSRICHPNKEVQNTLFTLIVKLIRQYPQHCLWMMASVFNSSYAARQKCCKEILNRDALNTTEMLKLIQCFNRFWEKLIELSNKHVPENKQYTTVIELSRSLPKLLADTDFGPIMMPTSKFRQLHLPMKGTSMEEHNPFPIKWVSIVGIGEKVAIMPSLQRPRRINLRGSDGKPYVFMCKPKDDLRRDFRLMEFNDIVNKYLQKDPESRRRRLYIRTYSVVPLNEECGLIEWVPNLIGYRNILMNIYKERNLLVSIQEIKAITKDVKDLERKKQVFLEKLIPRHPPVLGDWFHFAFPDPYGWYEARTAYIRTAAVMSMVGYILGLGDRHGENILIDSKCGDCVHVDFNCLFNRGETLEVPERVPFRLTHNMVEAMGPLKYEGPFRLSCQTTMKVLREQASTLISVLKPFIYDPLVSWHRTQLNDAGEKTNEKAAENIKSIEERLKGMVGARTKRLEALNLYLSVEGQVNHLILDAINVDNLCQMYIGWGAHL